jgi:hypothetical protein
MPAMVESYKLNDKDRAVILARIKAAKDRAFERDRNQDADSSMYASEGERNLALLGGTYWRQHNGDHHVRSVNHMAPVAISKYALITNGKREFIARPTKPRFGELTDGAKGLLNHTWRALSFDAECRAAFWDVAPLKFGVVEVGWILEDEAGQETRGAKPEPKIPEDAESITAPDGSMMPPEAQEYTDEPEAQRAMEIAEERAYGAPRRDDPFVERFDPRDLLVDPDCKRPDLSDARYVFRRKSANVAALKRNPLYSNTKDLKATGSAYAGAANSTTKAPAEASEAAREDFATTTVYDGYVWLSKGNKPPCLLHVVFAEGMDKELLCRAFDYEWLGQAKNPFPFELICNWRPSNDDLEPASDVSQTRWLQVEHDESYTQLSLMRRRGNTRWFGPDDLPDDAKEALEDGEEGRYVGLPADLLGRIKPSERPPSNIEAFRFLEAVPDEMRGQWGVNEFQANLTPDRKMLAAEVNALSAQGGTRQECDLEAYNDFVCRVGYKVLALLQQFSDATRSFAYTTEAGVEDWGKASLESLRGVDPSTRELEPVGIQFAIELDADGTGNRNKYSERQELSEMMSTLAPLKDMPDPSRPGMPMINTRTLLREYMKRYDIGQLNEIIAPEPEEGDKFATALQIIQQLSGQVKSLQAQVQQMQAPAGMPMMPGAPPAPGGPMI